MINEQKESLLRNMGSIDRRVDTDPKYEDALDDLPNDHWYFKWGKIIKYEVLKFARSGGDDLSSKSLLFQKRQMMLIIKSNLEMTFS